MYVWEAALVRMATRQGRSLQTEPSEGAWGCPVLVLGVGWAGEQLCEMVRWQPQEEAAQP